MNFSSIGGAMPNGARQNLRKLLLIMKFTTLIILIAIMQTSASTFAQKVSLSEHKISLAKVFEKIRQQTGYDFLVSTPILKQSKSVTIEVRDAELKDVLDQLFQGRGLDYYISDKSVVVSVKEKTFLQSLISAIKAIDIHGKVVDEKGDPLPGATILVKGRNLLTTTSVTGEFRLTGIDEKAEITISSVGYKTLTVKAGKEMGAIRMEVLISALDQVQVIGYGTTTKRLNTGTVTTISADDIAKEPISNPLTALQGNVPGLNLRQSSGLAGSTMNIQIRGYNSISQGSSPLFIIDGVPYPNVPIGTFSFGNGGQSPFESINPADIASIDVLKDADATSIYGSRGGNGVILITTKKGKAGNTKLDVGFYQGAGQVSRKLDLLNTSQYIEMRKEAFKNDGITQTAVNAPDLLLWDNNRYTDWQKMFIGGTANTTNANGSLSGGSENTQYILSANYNRQSSLFPGSLADSRGIGRFSISNKSADGKFKVSASGSYSSDNNQLPQIDLTRFIVLAPNAPGLYDQNGNLNWSENGGSFTNPLSYLLKSTTLKTDNFLGNVSLSYQVISGLFLKTTGGYNLIQLGYISLNPLASQDPNTSRVATSSFQDVTGKNWNIEPQIEYQKAIGKGKLDALIGTTIEDNGQNINNLLATGFPNDNLISAAGFATTVTAQTSFTEYKYQALFARLNYNWDDKYLLDITGRRDGSSRFGPGKQVANFGAVGAGWIFSDESFIKKSVPLISFGKLRGSYGITGNDQIGDYQYLDNYGSALAYQGQAGYTPSRLFNADYSWEITKKLEFAIELGLLANRINLTVDYFRNRSGNQLVNYTLPAQVGFTSILANFPALVQNSGWEYTLATTNIHTPKFRWNTSANLTVLRNKLLDFPNLSTSSYANKLVLGQPTTIIKYLENTGVNAQTGLYQFNGTSVPANQTAITNTAPKFYGGITNDLSYGNFNLSFLFHFARQNGVNELGASVNAPGVLPTGALSNQPTYALQRWQNAGDVTAVQKYTTSNSTGYLNLTNSNAIISDASFIRLKNLEFAYRLPALLASKIKMKACKIYVQGQNLLTFTNYKGLDPETATSYGVAMLPTLKTMVLGIQTTF